MSLSPHDLSEIRSIVESSLARQSDEVIRPIQNELQALRNDIKEIYDMIADLKRSDPNKKSLQKLSIEQKILELHSELIDAARQAGVTLPNH